MARRALGPASLAVLQAVRAALPATEPVLVACSGGADSLALAWAVRQHAGRPAAAVVDHGLQAGSAEQARATVDRLHLLGYVDAALLTVEVSDPAGRGPEAAARDARYAALSEASRVRGDAPVLLGHTLDDQAETVLLGLARGSGARSLAGMAARSGRWHRPLLGLRRATTEQACAELGLVPWQDPHNFDQRFRRVRVRRDVLPTLEAALGPGVAEALARTAALLADDADLLDELAAAAYAGLGADQPSCPEQVGAAEELSCADLLARPPALRRRVLLRWLRAHGVGDLAMRHVLGVERLVVDWHGQVSAEVPGGRVVRRDGRLRLD